LAAKVEKSALARQPAVVPEATLHAMTGVVPPVDVIGAVAVTLVTPAVVAQVGQEIAPPLYTIGAVPVIVVQVLAVAPPPPLVKNCPVVPAVAGMLKL